MRDNVRLERKARTILTAGAITGAIALTLPTTLDAQQAYDTRWLPWVGCWEAAHDPSSEDVVCVRPANEGVEVSSVSGGRVVATHQLIADARPYERRDGDCDEWQSATFSSDGLRVFLRSERTCGGGAVRTASAVMAISQEGDWIDAQSIGLGNERTARIVRYQATAPPRPEGFEFPSDMRMQVEDARVVASMRLTLDDVREAAGQVDPEALEALLIERDQTFQLDAKGLIALADAGVPERVIDLVVAVSYPDEFEIRHEGDGPAFRTDDRSSDQGYSVHYGRDPFGWGPYSRSGSARCGWGGFYRSSQCYGYGYGYGYGTGFGAYDPYGYGYLGRTIIVVRDGGSVDVRTGRVVKGRGYTRGGGSGSETPRRGVQNTRRRGSQPASSRGSGASGRRGSTASKGGYTRGGSRGSSGSSSGKAKPRNRS